MSSGSVAGGVPQRIAWARRAQTLRRFWRTYSSHRAGLAGLAFLVLACVAALLAPVFISAEELSLSEAPGPFVASPSWDYPLGTDKWGRSILHLIWQGARVSLTVGFLATFLSVVVGTGIGILTGHFRGWLESVLMRFTDWVLVLPTLVLAVALVVVMAAAPAPSCWPSARPRGRSQPGWCGRRLSRWRPGRTSSVLVRWAAATGAS